MKLKKNWRSKLAYQTQLDIKDISERNKKFHSLPISERRMEIALDVVHMLNEDMIRAHKRGFWSLHLEYAMYKADEYSSSNEFQKNLLNLF